ncbi:DUF6323 family protein [Enterococcus larvae]|uniref:DUF6323 family protein n=1 Tax=Enterococcus larvae TaxID=2794352 RepID=UPI003F33BB81
MSDDIVSLFNEHLPKDTEELNQLITHQELHLSEVQLQELSLKKVEALKASHLVDLSSKTQEYLVTQLDQSTLTTKENYFQNLIDLQEGFYFLRSNLPFSYSDDALLERLWAVFESCEGSIFHIHGVLEELIIKENMEGVFLNEGTDDTL